MPVLGRNETSYPVHCPLRIWVLNSGLEAGSMPTKGTENTRSSTFATRLLEVNEQAVVIDAHSGM